MVKKIISVLLIVLTLFVSSASFALAQAPTTGPWYAPTKKQFDDKVFASNEEEIFGERYTQAQVYWIFYSIQNVLSSAGFSKCLADGGVTGVQSEAELIDKKPTIEQCAENLAPTANGSSTSPAAYMDRGPILGLAAMIDTIRATPPASGVEYIAQKLQDFDLIPQAYAQGFGYTTLSSAQTLWTATRNMSYGLMVLVFIVFAFMIMLRVKLSPQTVISIQSALPRIALALVFITFSYAIAGLLIDASYLIQGLFAALIKSTAGVGANSAGITDHEIIPLVQQLNSPADAFVSAANFFLVLTLLFAVITLIPGIVTTIVGAIGAIFFFLVALAFLIALFRVFWLMVKTYAVLMLLIIGGPIYILWGTISLSGGLGSWVKAIVGHLSVFVAAGLLAFLAHMFFWGAYPTPWTFLADTRAFNPYLINPGQASLGAATLPGIGSSNNPGFLGLAVGFVVLFSIPSLANMMKDFILTGRAGRFESGIGSSFGLIKTTGGLAGGAGVGYVAQQLTDPTTGRFGKGDWKTRFVEQLSANIQKRMP